MVVTTTGIAFSLSSIGLAFCGIRFFEAFKKMGGLHSSNRIGILLSTLYILLSFQHGLLAVGGLFFSETPDVLRFLLGSSHLILAIASAIGVLLLLYVLFPKISPWPLTLLVLIFGLAVTFLTLSTTFQPTITAKGSIDWNMPYSLATLLYLLLVISLVAPFIVFVKNFFYAESQSVKRISLIVAVIQFLGILNVSILLTRLLNTAELRTKIFDFVLVVVGLLFVAAFLGMPIYKKWLSRLITSQSKQSKK